MSDVSSDAEDRRADVELTVPGEGAYVSVLRTTTAALAARLDFTLDDVEDLRMAVGEAASLVLVAGDGGPLTARFWLELDRMRVCVGTPCAAPAPVDEDSFAWQVLTTLAEAAVVPDRERFQIEVVVAATPLGASL